MRSQTTDDGTTGNPPADPPPPAIVGPVYDTSTTAGPHHRWQVITDENGNTTSRYLELATGLNAWDDATSVSVLATAAIGSSSVPASVG